MTGAERVLVLAPHTDDGEFGCGGTIARLIEEGAEVIYLVLSVPPPAEILRSEVANATTILGCQLVFMTSPIPVRDFPAHRQELLEALVAFERTWKPDLVLCPSAHDIHQDHQVVHVEALRAFKRTSVLGYELPWNNFQFAYQAFFRLEREHLMQKTEALACYESQALRPYSEPDYIEAVARAHGVPAGATYAEAFEVCRVVV